MKKQIKTSLLLFGLAVISVIAHNVISAIFKFEEAVFFSLTFVFFIGFVISLILLIFSRKK